MPTVTGTRSSIKMCFWNIGGLKTRHYDKTTDPLFLKEINKYDIVFLDETHIGDGNNIQNIGPFNCHFICRNVSKRNNRFFGGLAILCKPNIKNHIKILNNSNPDYQWVKFKKEYFNFDRDLFICLVYNPPSGSTYTQGLQKDILDSIEIDICKFKEKGNILLCGDFNARVGEVKDFITQDDNNYLPMPNDYQIDKILLERKSPDVNIDHRGKELIAMCVGNQLRILNGRTLGDMFGHFTCYTPNGASVVDYVIVSENILDQVLHFKISEFIPTLSDTHCKLEWTMSAHFNVSKKSQENAEIYPISQNFIWAKDSAEHFQLALDTEDVKIKLSNFNNNDIVSVDDSAAELNQILLNAASKSLKRRVIKKNKKPANMKWFDKDLKTSKSNLISYGQIYSRFPKDNSVKNHFYKLYREYKKLRKHKYREYKESILGQLESLHDNDPKLYWNLINEIKESKYKDQSNSAVEPSAWISHFTNLNTVKDKFKQRLNSLEILLDTMEKQITFNELDIKISTKEISKAISKLKINKAPGLDNISNNMIKSGHVTLIPSLQKLFNACLTSGNYPTQWAEGYIVPIHKSNDKHDPNNYRGITITSAVGKLFNCILDERLNLFLENHKIIHECQIGFTRNARTSDHMFILKCIIDEYCKSKEGRVYACFVDFQKAFDTVIHTGLKIKLLDIGVGTLFYNIVKNMYSVSRICIRVDEGITKFITTKLGVKQGDNLSPNLFKVFINDLPFLLEKAQDPVMLNHKPIHCLMYADDIVLLSSSEIGLQNKLNILEKFCDDWCLSLNPVKSKILVFNKAGRHICSKFIYQNHELECVQQYKYLGMIFCASGTFSFAQNELYNKALKALFKLQKDFFSLNPKIHTSLHVFDHTVKPILLYGCEIWGTFNCFSSKMLKSNNIQIENIFTNLGCEKLHLKFLKRIIGVHKNASNFAILSELGRFPLHFDIVKSMLNYWQRLENLEKFELLQDAYIHSKKLFEEKKPSWYGSIQTIITQIPEITINLDKNKKINKIKIFKILKNRYIKTWHLNHRENSEGKLRTYAKVKDKFGFENYINIINNFELRKNLCKFRISAHQLQIEKGRYQGLLLNHRICQNCSSGEVEDEIHFLFRCQKYKDEREILMKSIVENCMSFQNLDPEKKLIWILSCENPEILKLLGKFISNHT